MMEFQSVASTNVAEIGYDPDEKKLQVRFHNGSVYEYDGVSQETADELTGSSSPGRYVANVLKGQYASRRVQ